MYSVNKGAGEERCEGRRSCVDRESSVGGREANSPYTIEGKDSLGTESNLKIKRNGKPDTGGEARIGGESTLRVRR